MRVAGCLVEIPSGETSTQNVQRSLSKHAKRGEKRLNTGSGSPGELPLSATTRATVSYLPYTKPTHQKPPPLPFPPRSSIRRSGILTSLLPLTEPPVFGGFSAKRDWGFPQGSVGAARDWVSPPSDSDAGFPPSSLGLAMCRARSSPRQDAQNPKERKGRGAKWRVSRGAENGEIRARGRMRKVHRGSAAFFLFLFCRSGLWYLQGQVVLPLQCRGWPLPSLEYEVRTFSTGRPGKLASINVNEPASRICTRHVGRARPMRRCQGKKKLLRTGYQNLPPRTGLAGITARPSSPSKPLG